MDNKVKKLPDLKKILLKLKSKRKKIVFTNGCFDILHYGHISYLQKAKKLGDVLVVGLNSDASVRRLKGITRPVNNQFSRSRVLAALECVDFVVIFGEDTPINCIKLIKPDILVKASDWQIDQIVGSQFIRGYGGEVKRISFVKGYSTTGIINKLKNGKKSYQAH